MKLVVFLTLIVLTGCSTFHFPGVHRINIQQGNFITPQMIDKLKPGMSKNQAQYVLGQPVLKNPLNSDRWDYIHTMQISGNDPIQVQLTLYFVNERLDHFVGDYLPTEERKRLFPPEEPEKAKAPEESKEDAQEIVAEDGDGSRD